MTITALPTPPSRQDPANFAARGDALLTALPTFITEANALQTDVNAKQVAAAASANAAQLDRTLCAEAQAAVTAQSPVTNAAAAAASAVAAQAYASAAQATNPNSPIHTNPRSITADFTLGSGYNGWSAGPISIAESATLTIADNATLSII